LKSLHFLVDTRCRQEMCLRGKAGEFEADPPFYVYGGGLDARDRRRERWQRQDKLLYSRENIASAPDYHQKSSGKKPNT
jgi:hypothetical protein